MKKIIKLLLIPILIFCTLYNLYAREFNNDSARYEFIFQKFEFSEIVILKNFNRTPINQNCLIEFDNYNEALKLFYSSSPSILNYLYKTRKDTTPTFCLIGWNEENAFKLNYKNSKDSMQKKINTNFVLALNYLFNKDTNIIKLCKLEQIHILNFWLELENYILKNDQKSLKLLKRVYNSSFYYGKFSTLDDDEENE